MEPNSTEKMCQICHQPILPAYYFCPNCGTKINSAPLATSILTQLGIYLFSLILPFICFIFITRWPGLKYSKSNDPQARRIGLTAWILLILSTLVAIWLVWFSFVKIQDFSQALSDSLSKDLGNLQF